MRKVKLGDLEVSAIGLGCMTMTDAYGPSDRDEAIATLRRAVEFGVTLFDTANGYGQGENERLLGQVLAESGDAVTIATKFGFVAGADGPPTLDGHPDRVEDRCDESLDRLGTDCISLYYLHRPDPKVPIEDTVGAMARLVEKGKVRFLGLCEVAPETLRRANAVHPITAVQSEFSLWTRDAERGVLQTCEELGVGFVPFSPLGRAMLTGTINDPSQVEGESDFRKTLPRFQDAHFAHNRALVTALESIADDHQVSAAQLSLAWVLAKADFIAPIPGTRRRTWLEQNVQAADITLSAETVSDLDQIFDPAAVSGGRYGQSWMQSTDTAPDEQS
ncbi:MAG: aldo/keto reductase [Actinomycetota bacterium]